MGPLTWRIGRSAVSLPRGLRTRSAWLLAVPFLLWARPSGGGLAAAAALVVSGLLLRAWAAGTIRKDEVLTTTGPYAFVRHPLYLGSFLIAVGLALAGGHWLWPSAVGAYFGLVYARTLREETERLTALFGHAYVEYAARVPALLPRLTPYRGPADARPTGAWGIEGAEAGPDGGLPTGRGFAWRRYARNREWEALLGALAVLALLAAKWRLGR